MTTDITREALSAWLDETPDVSPSAARMILALRNALDEAERERDTQRTDQHDAREDDLRELAEWRAMFARLCAQGLPGATPLMPNDWSQDVAFVAFALHGRRDRVAELEAAVRALEGATVPLAAERDAAIARAEAAEELVRESRVFLWPERQNSAYEPSWIACQTCRATAKIDQRMGVTSVDEAIKLLVHDPDCLYAKCAALAKDGGNG